MQFEINWPFLIGILPITLFNRIKQSDNSSMIQHGPAIAAHGQSIQSGSQKIYVRISSINSSINSVRKHGNKPFDTHIASICGSSAKVRRHREMWAQRY